MATHDRSVGSALSGSDGVSFDLRSSLITQFLMASAMQARASAEIESKIVTEVTADDEVAHRGYVIGALMQATAALECEIWEVMVHGPGAYLGSNGIDTTARDFLAPVAEVIDGESMLQRYWLVLHLLRKNNFDRGAQPWQDAFLVVRLRNELVHYKSRWGTELERSKLLRALENKKHPPPPFVESTAPFFPYRCLSSTCASLGVQSSVAFLDAFYENLGFPGRLDPYRPQLRSTL